MLGEDTLFVFVPAFAQVPLEVSNTILMRIYLYAA